MRRWRGAEAKKKRWMTNLETHEWMKATHIIGIHTGLVYHARLHISSWSCYDHSHLTEEATEAWRNRRISPVLQTERSRIQTQVCPILPLVSPPHPASTDANLLQTSGETRQRVVFHQLSSQRCFSGGSVVKNLPANAGDVDSFPGSGRSPGEGNGNPFQYSCLGNLMDWAAWWATVHRVTKELDMT